MHSLDILRELREEAGLSQREMATRCGLQGRQSHQTVGAWERGEIVPSPKRRTRFIGYLWDHLRLRRDPARFQTVWAMLVEAWGWEPLHAHEWEELGARLRVDLHAIPCPRTGSS